MVLVIVYVCNGVNLSMYNNSANWCFLWTLQKTIVYSLYFCCTRSSICSFTHLLSTKLSSKFLIISLLNVWTSYCIPVFFFLIKKDPSVRGVLVINLNFTGFPFCSSASMSVSFKILEPLKTTTLNLMWLAYHSTLVSFSWRKLNSPSMSNSAVWFYRITFDS